MHVLDPGDHLIRKHAHCLEAEFAAAELELIFQGLAEHFHDHAFVVAFRAVPVGLSDAS